MSKGGRVESNTDPNTVTYLRKKTGNAVTLKTNAAVTSAKAQGLQVDTNRKVQGGTNRQHGTSLNTARLDSETEELKHDKLGLDVGRLIMQTRNSLEMNQKTLAQKINEKPQVINEYEHGKVVPNQQILAKMERVLGVKLRGKEKGMPLTKKSNPKGK